MARNEHQRSKVYLILRLARLHFLIPGFLLYLLGFLFGALRGGVQDMSAFLFGYSIFLTAHLSLHFSNDYFDREGDRLGQSNMLSGGSGVLVEHREMERLALMAAIGFLLLSVLLAGVFTLVEGFPLSFFIFSVAGALLGWFYSAPPLRFSSKGLSEIMTAFAAGFVMPGMGYFVSFGTIDLWFIILSMPLICFGAFFILNVEMPDVEADIAAKKGNLLTAHGRRFGARLSVISTAMGTILLMVIIASGVLGNEALFLAIGVLSVIPLAGAALTLHSRLSTREEVLRQVKINFGSLTLFILIVDVYLLVTVIL